jgi:hypothetical protein
MKSKLAYTTGHWEYVIKCVFAVEGHIILKIWLILRILKISSCTSLLTSNIEYGDTNLNMIATKVQFDVF